MDKKVAVVTGSKQGIGLATAKALCKEGWLVILSDVFKKQDVEGLLAEFHAEKLKVDYFKCDISKASDRFAIAEYAANKYGRIDLLVNNAGVALKQRMDILETTEESFDRLININTKGTFFMSQVFANKMLAFKKTLKDYSPRIINISSISAYTSSTSRGEYCISKAGISMITLLFADRLADEGVPVFEIRPGIILTDMTVVVKEKYEKLIAEGVTPIKRFGKPEDVANCVLSAASGLLDFGTGTVLNADGGFHIRRL